MKKLILLLALSITPAIAETYHCNNSGKSTFQDTPCKGIGYKFDFGEDISIEQQNAAKSKLAIEMRIFNNKKYARHVAWQKERAILAEEDKGYAAHRNANATLIHAFQQRRVANAIYDRNLINNRR